MTIPGGGGWVRFGVPGVVLGLALAGWNGGKVASVQAQGSGVNGSALAMPLGGRAPMAVATATAGGTVVLSTPTGANAQLLYVIDTAAKALAVYRVDPSNPKGMIKLEAARKYEWDLRLSEYNNLPPEVAAIESTVKSLGPQPSR